MDKFIEDMTKSLENIGATNISFNTHEMKKYFKADTIGALFKSTNDYYITISLTDNYCLYIEGLNEDYVSLVNNFKVEDIRHLMIELNDYNGNICITIQNYAELQGVGLETTINDLKEKVFDLAINKSILNS